MMPLIARLPTTVYKARSHSAKGELRVASEFALKIRIRTSSLTRGGPLFAQGIRSVAAQAVATRKLEKR
jgi:hypothetical protein